MKNICRNCHFLAKEYRGENRRGTFLSKPGNGNGTARGDPVLLDDHYPLKCHMGVWSKERLTEADADGIFTVSLNESDRKEAANGSLDFLQDRYLLKCYMGMWDEEVNSAQEAINEAINKTARKNRCYFFPHQPGMQFDIAEEFQQNEHTWVDRVRICMRFGFWLLCVGLLVNAIFGILGFYE